VFRRFGAGLHPRFVVSCLYVASDFENDDRYRSWVEHGHGRPYLEYQHELDAMTSTWVSPVSLLASMRFGPLLEKSWMYWKARALARRAWTGRADGDGRYRLPDGTELLMSSKAIAFGTMPAAADDPRVTAMAAAIRRLQTSVTEAGAHLIVVALPSKEELFGLSDAAAQSNVGTRLEQRLRSDGVPLADMYSPLRRTGTLQSPYFGNDIHLNALGNHVVAAEFAAWFREQTAMHLLP
jgi:hypothetical protein